MSMIPRENNPLGLPNTNKWLIVVPAKLSDLVPYRVFYTNTDFCWNYPENEFETRP